MRAVMQLQHCARDDASGRLNAASSRQRRADLVDSGLARAVVVSLGADGNAGHNVAKSTVFGCAIV